MLPIRQPCRQLIRQARCCLTVNLCGGARTYVRRVLKLTQTTQTLAERVGARIVALRQERGWTQEALAWQAEFGSKGYLSRIESGQRMPSVAVLERLAKELGVELCDLFVFPEESVVDAAHEAVRRGGKLLALRVLDLANPRKRR